MELLIGAGNNRDKKITFKDIPSEWSGELVTLDIDPECNPDIIHDLNDLPMPFDDDMFDEIHAYEVLEHTGRQGDWLFFFNQFSEFWRILIDQSMSGNFSRPLTVVSHSPHSPDVSS